MAVVLLISGHHFERRFLVHGGLLYKMNNLASCADAKTQEELQEELTSLSRALEALEVESASGVLGGSPSQSSTVPSEQEQGAKRVRARQRVPGFD